MAAQKRKATGGATGRGITNRYPVSAREAVALLQPRPGLVQVPVNNDIGQDRVGFNDERTGTQQGGEEDYDSEIGMGEDEEADSTIYVSRTVEQHEDAILSTWAYRADNHSQLDGNDERLRLRYDDTLTLAGQYYVNVRYGVVSLSGAVLTSSSPRRLVLAPICDPLPSMRCLSGDWADIELSSVAKFENIECLQTLNPIIGQLWTCKCIKCIPFSSQSSYTKLHRSSDFHQQKDVVSFGLPADWQHNLSFIPRLISERHGNRVVPILGPSSGDTARLCQVIINTCLSNSPSSKPRIVVLLDLDPSLPMAGYPGHVTISILSQPILRPPWCRSGSSCIPSAFTLAVGEHRNSAVLWQQMYAEATSLQLTIPDAVLLIRYPAASNVDVAVRRLQLTSPLHSGTVLWASTEAAARTASSDKDGVLSFSQLPGRALRDSDIALRNQWTLQMYFHLYEQPQGQTDVQALSIRRPTVVSYGRADVGANAGTDFLGICFIREIPSTYPKMLRDLIDGTLISIAILSSSCLLDPANIRRGEDDNIPYFLNGSSLIPQSRVIGLALIRAIDLEQQCLHLVLQSESVDFDNPRLVLIAGAMDTPSWAFTEDLYIGACSQQRETRTNVAHAGGTTGRIPWTSVQPKDL